MESVKRERIILASASASAFIRFSLPIFWYVGSSSCELRAVCSKMASTIAEHATVVRIDSYLPLNLTFVEGQKKIIEILQQRPRMKTLDISDTCFIEEHLISFGWLLFNKFPNLNELLMVHGCNAIITTEYMRDYYASFRSNSLHTRQTVIEILIVALANEDTNTIQKFSYSLQACMDLSLMEAKRYKCTYIENEEEGSFVSGCCLHDIANAESRNHHRWTLMKAQGLWKVTRVRPLNNSNLCDVCWM